MRNKGFTAIELIVVMFIVFFVLLIMVIPFLLPSILDKYIGDAKIVDTNLPVAVIVDNVITVKNGQRFKVEVEPPLPSEEEVSLTLLTSPEGLSATECFGNNNKFWLKWTPSQVGDYAIDLEFSVGEKKDISKILIKVVE